MRPAFVSTFQTTEKVSRAQGYLILIVYGNSEEKYCHQISVRIDIVKLDS